MHAVQAVRFGNDLEACLKAIQIGFELSPRPNDAVYKGALKTLEMVRTSLLRIPSFPSPLSFVSLPLLVADAEIVSPLFLPGLQEVQEGVQGGSSCFTNSHCPGPGISTVRYIAYLL